MPVSLDVDKGTMTAVIGPSGSGKSSLLAVAATLISADSGQVIIDGTPTSGLSRGELTTLRRNKSRPAPWITNAARPSSICSPS